MHDDGPGSVEVLEEDLAIVGLLNVENIERPLSTVDVVKVLGHPVK